MKSIYIYNSIVKHVSQLNGMLMKKVIFALLTGLFLFMGGSLIAEDLPPPISDGVNVEYVIMNVNQVALVDIHMIVIDAAGDVEFINVVNPINVVVAVACINVGYSHQANDSNIQRIRKTVNRVNGNYCSNIGYTNWSKGI